MGLVQDVRDIQCKLVQSPLKKLSSWFQTGIDSRRANTHKMRPGDTSKGGLILLLEHKKWCPSH